MDGCGDKYGVEDEGEWGGDERNGWKVYLY